MFEVLTSDYGKKVFLAGHSAKQHSTRSKVVLGPVQIKQEPLNRTEYGIQGTMKPPVENKSRFKTGMTNVGPC